MLESYRVYSMVIILVSIMAISIFSSSVFAILPVGYQKYYSAEEKQDELWDYIVQSNEAGGIPNANTNGWTETYKKIKALLSLDVAFDHVGDELPSGRVKLIHASGSVGKIQFVPDAAAEHPFTGIYQSGGIGLARLSLAVSPRKASFTPGIALKFFVKGQPSLNVMAMYSLNGQGKDWNFFSNTLTSKIDHPRGIPLKFLEWIFASARNPATDLPVSHLAGVDMDGVKVVQPCSPEMLIFRPADNVKSIIHPGSRVDFRESLLLIPQGELYEVYGTLEGSSYHIGTIRLVSTLLASEYGDKDLFFQHKR